MRGLECNLGKGEVVSSILTGSTTEAKQDQHLASGALPCPPRLEREQDANSPTRVGENRGSAFNLRSLEFPITIAQWDHNAREVVRVALDLYNGRHTINARVWYRDDDDLKPSKSGITLAVKHLPALADAIGDALDKARDLGLLHDGGER